MKPKSNAALILVDGSTKSEASKPKREKKAPLTKEESLKGISAELGPIRDVAASLNKLVDSLTRSVSNQVDLNLSHKEEARNVIEGIGDAEDSVKRILTLVVARCRARLEE